MRCLIALPFGGQDVLRDVPGVAAGAVAALSGLGGGWAAEEAREPGVRGDLLIVPVALD